MSLAHLVLLNFALAAYLTGVSWVVQLVTYPALKLVGKAEFARYHAAHTRGMGWVVGAPMVLELALAAWLAWVAYPLGGSGRVAGHVSHRRAFSQSACGAGLQLHCPRWPRAHQLAAHPGLDGPGRATAGVATGGVKERAA